MASGPGWTAYGADPNARFWRDPATIVRRLPRQPRPPGPGRPDPDLEDFFAAVREATGRGDARRGER